MTRSDAEKVLGLGPGATPAQVKAAYRARATQFHPDKHSGDPAAEVLFRMIRDAYEVLRVPPEAPPEPGKPKGVPKIVFDLIEKAAEQSSREELSALLGDSSKADALQHALRSFLAVTRAARR
jgi:hypothetical protein